MTAVVRFLLTSLAWLVLAWATCWSLQAQPAPARGGEWVTRLNPQDVGGSIRGLALARDATGNLYITGAFTGVVRLGEQWLRAPNGGTMEAGFVAQLSPAGRWRWARVLSSADGAASGGESVATDAAGGVYVTGSVREQVRFAPHLALGDEVPGRTARAAQHFVARLDTAGHWQWAQAMAVAEAGPS